jgi:hypothetical protein
MKIFVLFVIGLIIVILLSSMRGRSRNRVHGSMEVYKPRAVKPHYDESKLPGGLGLARGIPLQSTIQRMESALGEPFTAKLKQRVLTKYPDMTAAEFACRWFELKRFFLINFLLKETPMFSEAIDDVWHEMLMFTREYHNFSEQFMGAMIHHEAVPGSGRDGGADHRADERRAPACL